ncbi:hypothetical protein NDI85_19715 [Halomicroarcula sp. S1AR25-4]|uniref:hypothetical protein n=1 Tax=Haloarcula sp. S1AR25-4 TaxID=2950538 RepID=UPI002876A26F|nr:hypothetical protein [Halomicroarcula sp. S1AR25-4]MDS0280016.1 hypothetical protein [Halomicroarcula sp. S1AR25-4]
MSTDIDQHLDEQRATEHAKQRPPTEWNQNDYKTTEGRNGKLILYQPHSRGYAEGAWLTSDLVLGLEDCR